jgi:hypothetical protein
MSEASKGIAWIVGMISATVFTLVIRDMLPPSPAKPLIVSLMIVLLFGLLYYLIWRKP